MQLLSQFEALQREDDAIYQYLQLNCRPSTVLNVFTQINGSLHELGPLLVQPASVLTASKFSVLRSQFQLVSAAQLAQV